MSTHDVTQPGLVLLTAGTPNGHKPSILLEELKLIGAIPGYEFIPISFSKGEQKEQWFLDVNPNGRIPALVDNRAGKKPINIWESASILLYLANTYDKEFKFHFKDADEQAEMMNWIFFIQGGAGPMMGQANHFFRYAPEKIPYGINRYQTESKRLFSVYEDRLATGVDYLCGNKYSLADICTFPWIRIHNWSGVPIDDFPLLAAWVERLEQREGVKAGLAVPEQDSITARKLDPVLAEAKAKEASAWIMQGIEKEKAALAAKTKKP